MAERPESDRFHPTGRPTGWACVLLAGLLAVLTVVEHDRGIPAWVLAAAVCLATVGWVALLRPRVAIVGRWLELRNPFETVWIRLASVDELAIGRYLAVSAAGRRWTCAALGRTGPQTRRDARGAGVPGSPAAGAVGGRHGVSYAGLVERKLRDAVHEARRATDQAATTEPVVRRRAWPEISLVVLTALVTLVLLLL